MFESLSKQAIGSFLLLLVCVLWVASSELTQFIFSDLAFSRPYFFTWFATSMFQFYLVGFLVCKPWRQRCVFHNGSLTAAPLTRLYSRSFRTVSLELDDPNSVSLLNPTAQSQYGRRVIHEMPRPSSPRVRFVSHFLPDACLFIF
jgi:hypothetical protein